MVVHQPGRSTDLTVLGSATAALAVAAFAAGFAWGALGVAVAYATSESIKTLVLWAVLGRKRARPPRYAPWACGPTVGVPSLVAAVLAYVTFAGTLLPFAHGRATLREATQLDLRPARSLGRSARPAIHWASCAASLR